MSPDSVIMALGAFVLIVYGLVTVLRAARGLRAQRRARKAGLKAVGRVTGLNPKYRSYYGLYQLTPIVSYDVNKKTYETPVANLSGAREIGSTVDVAVDPRDLYRTFAVYGRVFNQALAVGIGFTVGGGIFLYWSQHL